MSPFRGFTILSPFKFFSSIQFGSYLTNLPSPILIPYFNNYYFLNKSRVKNFFWNNTWTIFTKNKHVSAMRWSIQIYCALFLPSKTCSMFENSKICEPRNERMLIKWKVFDQLLVPSYICLQIKNQCLEVNFYIFGFNSYFRCFQSSFLVITLRGFNVERQLIVLLHTAQWARVRFPPSAPESQVASSRWIFPSQHEVVRY